MTDETGAETPEAVRRDAVLQVTGLSKRFGGVRALQGIDFELRQGEVAAIVGDNGAGKSTFIKTLTGVEQPDEGTIAFDGRPVRFHSPHDARGAGIETVYQNLALADHLDVAANIFLGREQYVVRLGPFSVLNHRAMARRARELLDQTGVKIPDIRVPIRTMSGGQRQGVAVARAAGWGSKLIIMDEPTAALGVQETARVEAIIRRLRDRGIAILLVSHNLRQVFDLVDTIWVFRLGRIVGRRRTAETSNNEIVAMITGVAAPTGPQAA